MSRLARAERRTIGLDIGSGDDTTAMVVAIAWPDGTTTLDSTILTDDERLGLSILLGQAGPLSYNDTLRGAQAVEALAARKGLDLREFSHAFADWRARERSPQTPPELAPDPYLLEVMRGRG
jgi:hypothetical protein